MRSIAAERRVLVTRSKRRRKLGRALSRTRNFALSAPKQTRCLYPEKESARAKAGVWAPRESEHTGARDTRERVIQGTREGRARDVTRCDCGQRKGASVLGAETLGGTLGDADEGVVGRRMRVVALRGAAERVLRGSGKARKAISSRFTEAAAARHVVGAGEKQTNELACQWHVLLFAALHLFRFSDARSQRGLKPSQAAPRRHVRGLHQPASTCHLVTPHPPHNFIRNRHSPADG